MKEIIIKGFVCRLLKLIDFLKLKKGAFAHYIGIPKSTLSEILNIKTKPTFFFFYGLSKIEKLNINWLLTGEGEMFIEQENKKVILPEDLEEMFELIKSIPEIKQTLLAKLTESKAIFNKEVEEYIKKIENPDEDPEMKTAG